MKVAIFSYARLVQFGGFERFVVDVAAALARRGHDVAVVTTNVAEHRVLQVGMNVLYHNPLLYDQSSTTSSLLRARVAPATLRELSPAEQRRLLQSADVIYAKNELVDLTALLPYRGALPPVVCGMHTPLYYPEARGLYSRLHNTLYLGGVYRTLLQVVSAVHCLSAEHRALFRCHGLASGLPIHEIPLPVPVVPSPPPAATESPIALFAGRLTEQKGVDVLLQAARLLHDAGNPVRFCIAGAGRAELVSQVTAAAAADSLITYLGHLSADTLAQWYQRAQIAVVPSRWETFPYACVEALASAVPVVCSDIPGSRGIVRHGDTGFLVPAGDPAALAEAIRRFATMAMQSPDDYAAFRHRAIAEVKARFSPERVYDQIEGMLNHVRGGGRRESGRACGSRPRSEAGS